MVLALRPQALAKAQALQVSCSVDSWSAPQDMLRDTARGGAGTNPMMSYITDAAPQQGEATMRAGRHAEVSAAAPA